MTIIESIRDFVAQFPRFNGESMGVDFLPPEVGGYSVDSVPTNSIVKRYRGGATEKQYLFTVATRAYFGEEILQQIQNLGLFEDFQTWMQLRDYSKEYPDLGPGRQVKRIEVTSTGYAYLPDATSARYQTQCRILYWEKATR